MEIHLLLNVGGRRTNCKEDDFNRETFKSTHTMLKLEMNIEIENKPCLLGLQRNDHQSGNQHTITAL
jgi:hypothetical protein